MDLPKQYTAKEHEDSIYAKWLAAGYFNPDNLPDSAEREPFAIMMPPPNVTGVLHLGHALENSLMDIQARYQRMLGKKVLLLAGTDHAAVATQARVETNLKKSGMSNPRQELGREGLLKEIREYAEQSKATILNQIKKMGTSADWDRLAYTFDEPRNAAVNEVFKRMYADGLIYRGYRVINWSVKGQSTCSDDELVYVDQPAKLYTFKYSADFPIAIASTRPETKLGDTAVAVHPAGKYKQYIGQQFTVEVGAATPLTITIIGDDSVDENYGTGALGVTPAHSAIDFEMYQKNKTIGLIQVIDKTGCMTEAAGHNYVGLTIQSAREKFVEYLKSNNLLIKEEDITHNVATSDRFGDVIESIPMEQWFVDVNKVIPGKDKSLKDLMREAVTTQAVHITPDRFVQTYLHWIDNLRDWCISRQIWWGHRIPVWYRGDEKMVSATQPAGDGWTQDEDTLDTWFSSGMWTFSTLGWPTKTKDFQDFHPTAWMQMGHEILFFWMARMIMMSMYLFDEVPFRNVYIHGILRDKSGKKFSKSLGNGIDPLDIIAKYGTDALRLSLIKGITPGNDARFYEEKVEDSRNFVNKLWNVTRFVLTPVTPPSNPSPAREGGNTLTDDWIQSKTAQLITTVTEQLNTYQFSQAAENIYNFLWHDFADWYIEIKKFEPNLELTKQVLEIILKLLHPFVPFVTEAIWQELYPGQLLMIQEWPKADQTKINKRIEDIFEDTQDTVKFFRDFRKQKNISFKINLAFQYLALPQGSLVKNNEELEEIKLILSKFIKVQWSNVIPEGQIIKYTDGNITFAYTSIENTEEIQKRLQKEINEIKPYVLSQERKLSNQDFISKAPANIIEIEQKKLAEKKAILEKLLQDLQ